MSDDDFSFIFGDSYGEIETEVLGSMNGTTTREMHVPDRLARELYDDLDEYFTDTTDLYLVVVDKPTGFAELANVVVVEATSEQDAKNRVDDLDNSQNFGPYRVEKIEEIETPYQYYV